jgi:hypothetical protein
MAGACADDQSITSPQPNVAQPKAVATTREALEPVATPTVTLNPAKTGTIRLKPGFVELSAGANCSTSGLAIRVAAYLNQDKPGTSNDVAGYGEGDVACIAGVSVPFFIPVVMNPLNPLPEKGRVDVRFKVLTSGVNADEVVRAVRLVESAQ